MIFTNEMKSKINPLKCRALKLQKLMKYGCIVGGIIGLILGGIAGYIQTENERNETRMISAISDTNELTIHPKVLSIDVMSNDEKY